MLIRVVDLETTGFKPPEDAVCEIGWTDIASRRLDVAGAPADWCVSLPLANLVNPGKPIPPVASSIHHITDNDIFKEMPPGWSALAPTIVGPAPTAGIWDGVPEVFAAHSAKFERQWITDELTGGVPWICTYKCGLRLWPDAPAHSNQALRYWHQPPGLIREHAAVAHRAGPDSYVTAHLLASLLELAPVEKLIEWSSQPALQVTCHIGQYRGQPWTQVPESFLSWISYRDFDEDVLFTVRHELQRRSDERAKPRTSAPNLDDEMPF